MDGEQQKRQGQQGAMEAQSTELITTDPLGLDSLAAKIAAEPERFANGDAELAEASRAALKRIYDACKCQARSLFSLLPL